MSQTGIMFMPAAVKVVLFHGRAGKKRVVPSFLPSITAGKSDEPYWLFATPKPSVAKRYGTLYQTELSDIPALPRISVRAWMWGEPVPEGSFIIEQSDDNPDFPADTYVLDARERWVSELVFARAY